MGHCHWLEESTASMNEQLGLREDNTETDLELTNYEMPCRNDGDSIPVKSKRVTYEKYKKRKKSISGTHKNVCLEIIPREDCAYESLMLPDSDIYLRLM